MKPSQISKRQILISSVILTALLSVPFFFGRLRFGADTTYHINRMIALSEAIRNHDFYPGILFSQNYGYGYGSPLFYSIAFLYPAALLILAGLPPVLAYKGLILLLAFFSACFMQRLTSRFTQNRLTLIFSAALYLLNNYYFSDIFYRGALGEAMAFIFLPLLLDSIHRILTEDNRSAYPQLIVSFGGLLLSHNITFLFSVVLFAVFLLVNLKQLNRKKILYIAISTVFTMMLTSFYLYPMLHHLSGGIYRVSHYINQEMGGEPLSALLYFSMEHIYVSSSCGLFLLLTPLFAFVFRKEPFLLQCGIFGSVLLLLCTNLIPWKYLGFLSVIQWPGRFMILVLPLFSLPGALIPERLKKEKALPILLAMLVCYTAFLDYGIYRTGGEIHDFDTPEELSDYFHYYPNSTVDFWYNSAELSTPDYLIQDAAISFPDVMRSVYRNEDHLIGEIRDSHYNYLSFTVQDSGTYCLPLSYYDGYTVQVFENGQYVTTLFPSLNTENGLLNVTIDAPVSNREYVVRYQRSKAEKACFALSALSLVLLVFITIQNQRKRSGN